MPREAQKYITDGLAVFDLKDCAQDFANDIFDLCTRVRDMTDEQAQDAGELLAHRLRGRV